MNKTVAVIDAGGRGAALVYKYAQSPQVSKILAIPGNDLVGINTEKEVRTYTNLKTTSIAEIIQICKEEKVDLVDVAQDNALAVGLVDRLKEAGIKAFGPTKQASQIEWDKAWSREFMQKYDLPSPTFKIFDSESKGIDFINSQDEKPWVIKASGLAEGKGVIITKDKEEAVSAIKEMKKFNESGKVFVLEEFLEGEEFSAFALSDGEDFTILGSAQDHKRIFDGDQGPNTGGVGCSTPPLVINEKIHDQIITIFEKAFAGLKKEGRPYSGILYLGGIVLKDGFVSLIEFNSRWGDPEVECILPGIKNDLYELSMATIEGRLKDIKIEIDSKARVVVAGASKGYPEDYSAVKGKQIFGIEEVLKLPGIKFYSAGIKRDRDKYLANGGRLFYIVGEGKDVIEAREKAYSAIKLISIEGDNLHYRTDIGYRDVERLSQRKSSS